MFVYCHVVIFAETMVDRDLEQEELLGDIIRDERDVLSYLNDPDGQKGEDDCTGARTEEVAVAKSGEVYILIKPVLTN